MFEPPAVKNGSDDAFELAEAYFYRRFGAVSSPQLLHPEPCFIEKVPMLRRGSGLSTRIQNRAGGQIYVLGYVDGDYPEPSLSTYEKECGKVKQYYQRTSPLL
ncbi:hypothetical protein Bbelb_105210 [Branchiostoma belcheri]|nr:hypothetical protein Bbelb_105210 [Branchiostoma belcheri]